MAEEITITLEKPESEMTLEEKVEKSKEIIKKAIEHWKPHIGIAFSGGKDSTVILSLIREVYGRVPIPVMTNDTGVKFQETYDFRNRLKEEWGTGYDSSPPQKELQRGERGAGKVLLLAEDRAFRADDGRAGLEGLLRGHKT